MTDETDLDRRAKDASQRFAREIYRRRKELGLKQDELALSTGVNRRFIIELESGKPTAQLGKSLLVAQRLGINFSNEIAQTVEDGPDLPDFEDDEEGAYDGPRNTF